MSQNYYLGSYKHDGVDGPDNGWLVGSFIDDQVRQTKDVEIKYWHFPVGRTDHDTKKSTVLETTFIIEGIVSGEIDGQPITMRAGDYMVIPAGVENNVPMEVLEPASGITVKAPSSEAAKTVTEER